MVLITMLLVKSDESGGKAAAGAGKGKEMRGSLPALCERILPPLLPDD
jgi:hypothetical protein